MTIFRQSSYTAHFTNSIYFMSFFNSVLYHFPFTTEKLKKEVIPCAFSTIKKDYYTRAVRISTFKKAVPMPACSFPIFLHAYHV